MGMPIQHQALNASALRVLEYLRQGPMTVEDLARVIRITPNAVRNQLVKLTAARLVVRSGSRPGPSKPSALYSITMEGQAQFSRFYLPVLTEFLKIAEERCTPSQLISFMTQTGASFAKRYPKPNGDPRARTLAGARLLKTLGGIPEVQTNPDLAILSWGCPLAALTSENQAACRVIEGLLAEYIGQKVKTCCTREPELRCCFQIAT